MESSLFLQTLLGEKTSQRRPPVWFMRQAGRSLKNYRDLKKKHTFSQLLYTPELACEITLLPLKDLKVDALILFSDILVVLEAIGIQVDYDIKPTIINPLKETEGKINPRVNWQGIEKIYQTIKLVKAKNTLIPLIGFCGGPMTLFLYLFQGSGHQGNFSEAIRFFYTQPKQTDFIFDLITEASINYAQGQIENGVDAFQIFETWAGIIPEEIYLSRVMPWVRKIARKIAPKVPIIFFPRAFSTGYFSFEEDVSLFKGIGIDTITSLQRVQPTLKNFTLQGNLDPHLVKYGNRTTLQQYLKEYLKFYQTHPRWIVNLGHGVLPETPEENLRWIVEQIRSFSLS